MSQEVACTGGYTTPQVKIPKANSVKNINSAESPKITETNLLPEEKGLWHMRQMVPLLFRVYEICPKML